MTKIMWSSFSFWQQQVSHTILRPLSPPQILEAALLIIGGAIEAGKAIYEKRVGRAVALGCGYHHAGRDYGLRRALILDYDMHFGNETSDIYYSDPDVLYISLHQDPRTIYPGTGFVEQIGTGAGEGYNVNIPLPRGTGDKTYLYALRETFVPLAEEFEPELIIANGGSDPTSPTLWEA